MEVKTEDVPLATAVTTPPAKAIALEELQKRLVGVGEAQKQQKSDRNGEDEASESSSTCSSSSSPVLEVNESEVKNGESLFLSESSACAPPEDSSHVRRKSVTIQEAPITVDADFLDSISTTSPLPPSASSVSPARSALKKREQDVKFVIKNTDPIGRDRTEYSFNKYQMPLGQVSAKEGGVFHNLYQMERSFAILIARISVLLGRSSGRDKAAAVVQYCALFWGSQPFTDFMGIKDGPEAPWKKLEDSMSSGRKVFRLGKWLKEYEKGRVALTAPDSYLGVIPNGTRALLTRFLAVSMNFFSFWYYMFDNWVWAANSNLINRNPDEKVLRKQLLDAYPTMSYEKYRLMHAEYADALQRRTENDARVERWKDWKNWSSLGRLAFALIHCMIQIKSLYDERDRLILRYKERMDRALCKSSPEERNAEREQPPLPLSRKHVDRYDSLGSASEKWSDASPSKLREERDKRINEVMEAVEDQKREVLAVACNLGILLNRLNFRYFVLLPKWVIGILGVVSGICGCLKNWPTYVPEPKQNKLARKRQEEEGSQGFQ